MNTEILFCGDAHGKFAHILAAAERLMPMTVVLLGDMEFPRPAHLERNSPTSTVAVGPVSQMSTRGRSSSKATRHF